MAEPLAQHPHRRLARRVAPEQRGGNGYPSVPDAQPLQHEQQGGDGGQARQHAGRGQVGESHTDSAPPANSGASWPSTSSSTSTRRRPAPRSVAKVVSRFAKAP